MDPTITAAWITGGVGAVGIAGTVVTAIVGGRNTRQATEITVAAGAATTTATLAAARDDRLWDKRCVVYEETLADLLRRQAKRRQDLREGQFDQATEAQLEAIHDDDLLGLLGLLEQGRLTAYASDAVLGAFLAASRAHGEVLFHYRRYRMTVDAVKRQAEATHGMADGSKETVEAHKVVSTAVEEAEVHDQALIVLIREELRSKPEAAMLPASEPPRRRRI
jgi:hypothetical protein